MSHYTISSTRIEIKQKATELRLSKHLKPSNKQQSQYLKVIV